MDNEIIFTDRYGGNYPDPETMCLGDCEGMGWVPIKKDDPGYAEKWEEAEKLNKTDDEYHFVKCNQCGGTGKNNKINQL